MSKREEIGKKIKALRQERHLTQADLARAIGKVTTTVTMYEAGKREPEIDTLDAIAKVFKVPLRKIITDDSMSAEDEDRLEALHQNPRLGLLFDMLRKMSRKDVEFMIELVNRIIWKYDDFE